MSTETRTPDNGKPAKRRAEPITRRTAKIGSIPYEFGADVPIWHSGTRRRPE